MKELIFKRDTPLQREMLQRLTEAVREYLEVIEKPQGGRHRKTIISFIGDRYRPETINTKFIIPKHKDQ